MLVLLLLLPLHLPLFKQRAFLLRKGPVVGRGGKGGEGWREEGRARRTGGKQEWGVKSEAIINNILPVDDIYGVP